MGQVFISSDRCNIFFFPHFVKPENIMRYFCIFQALRLPVFFAVLVLPVDKYDLWAYTFNLLLKPKTH
ncbi:MAG: hypothetical protein CSB24_06355 [Deltaproteobacteria bacterium]|nr:MAG: hypothetical protein CSB24_06355 [Deltaproteobacteria bacterium]